MNVRCINCNFGMIYTGFNIFEDWDGIDFTFKCKNCNNKIRITYESLDSVIERGMREL